MAVKTGWLSQFGLSTMMLYEPTLEIVPSGPGVAGAYFLASRPVPVQLQSDGSFTVTLIPNEQVTPETWYTLRLTWQDDVGRMESLDIPEWKFIVRNVNGPLLDDAVTVPHGLEVWIGTEDNRDYRFWYHPITTELRYGMSRELISVLRGLPGYNATGAAQDDAAIAQKIRSEVGTTETRKALGENFVSRRLPDGLTGGARYDAFNAIYGVDRVPRQAMKILADAQTSHKKIAVVGHSLPGGSGSGTAWPTRLRNILAGTIPQNSGIVMATQASSPTDTQWTIGAGWSRFSSDNLTLFLASTSAGSLATFQSLRAGTIVEIWTNGQSVPFEYRIDNGSWVTFTPTGTFACQRVSVTGLANTPHKVDVRSLTAGNTFLYGVEVRNATGLSLTNLGAGGSLSMQWNNPTWYTLGPMFSHLGPWDLTFIEISTNDMRNNVSIAGYKTNVQSIIDRATANGGTVVLVVDPQPNTVNSGSYAGVPASVSAAYRQAAYDLADVNNIRVLDLQGLFGPFTQADADGNMFDPVHLSDVGAQRVSRAADRIMEP